MGRWGVLLAACLTTVSAHAGPIMFRPSAALAGPEVTLGDVADLSPLPAWLRPAAAAVGLAPLPAGHAEAVLSTAMAAERARAAMPVLAAWLPELPEATIALHIVHAAGQALAGPAACLLVTRPLAAGEVALARDFAPATCDAAPPGGAFRYDRPRETLLAARDLAPGERTAAVAHSDLAAFDVGEPLDLTVRVGPTTSSRRVLAAQPARPGRAVFVRGSDGAVFRAPAPEPQP